jgi:hypothetical protein
MLVIDIIDWNDDTKLPMFKARLKEAVLEWRRRHWANEGTMTIANRLGPSASVVARRDAANRNAEPRVRMVHPHPQKAE